MEKGIGTSSGKEQWIGTTGQVERGGLEPPYGDTFNMEELFDCSGTL